VRGRERERKPKTKGENAHTHKYNRAVQQATNMKKCIEAKNTHQNSAQITSQIKCSTNADVKIQNKVLVKVCKTHCFLFFVFFFAARLILLSWKIFYLFDD
jgi:hypothetical protein